MDVAKQQCPQRKRGVSRWPPSGGIKGSTVVLPSDFRR